jgi:hypothetical protein
MYDLTTIWIGFGIWALIFLAFSLHLAADDIKRRESDGDDNV